MVMKRLSLLFAKKAGWIFLYSFIAICYITNLSRDIFGGDVGDLVTSSITHGIAHPPGYPLFVILGYLFHFNPLPIEPVTKVGLVSIIASIASLVFFQRIIALFIKNTYFQALAVVVTAFSFLFWLYAEMPEVFALNTCLSLLSIYSALLFYKYQKFKYLLLVFFSFGLGLTNHMTIILTIPLLVTVLFVRREKVIKFKKRLLFLPAAFLVGLLPYIYLPAASLTNPIIEWNKIDSLSSFFHHVLRSDYGTFSAGAFNAPDPSAKLVILKVYFLTVIRSITFPAFLISLLGFLRFFKKDKAIASGLFITVLFSGPFFIAYSGFPIADNFVLGISERFYLLSSIVLLIFLPFGLDLIYAFLQNVLSKKIYSKIIISIFVLIPVLMLVVNFPKTALSKTTMGTEFAKDYFKNLPPNSLLFLTGDTRSFNSWYIHYVLGYRNDVDIVQIGGFGIKDKYFDSLSQKIQEETGFDGNELFLNALLRASEEKKIYSMIDIPIPKSDFVWLQTGMSLELFKKKNIPDEKEYSRLVEKNFKNINILYEDNLTPVERNLVLKSNLMYYAGAVNNIGSTYLSAYNDKKLASLYFNKAVLIYPEYSESYKNLAILYTIEGQCAKAEENIKKAISLYPVEIKYYLIWNGVARQCFKKEEKVQEVNKAFFESFGLDLEEVIKKNEKK